MSSKKPNPTSKTSTSPWTKTSSATKTMSSMWSMSTSSTRTRSRSSPRAAPLPPPPTTTEEGAEEEDDDEDLVEPDDVEAALDTILKDRLVAVEEDADEEDEEVEVDDRGDPVDRILPKRPGEFVCQSCFLVKHPSQLADEVHMYCRDCV